MAEGFETDKDGSSLLHFFLGERAEKRNKLKFIRKKKT